MAGSGSGPDHVDALAGGRLTIDLDALIANYRRLQRLSQPARVAGIVKANGYGLGIDKVVPALAAAGCRQFFVALAEEGLAARSLAPQADIFVLNGLFDARVLPAYRAGGLIPVLNSIEDIALWRELAGAHPCALHVDTGMNRLGLTVEDALALAGSARSDGALDPVLVMSHLACADEPAHALNRRQLEAFRRVRAAFPAVPASLANSAGCLLGSDYHFDLVRPGIALYGGAPASLEGQPARPVVTLEARIIQIRKAEAGQSVSYGASATVAGPTLVAVAAVGYGDGYHRAGSGSGVALRAAMPNGAHGFLAGRKVPVLGRITMDLTMFDVTGVDAAPGDHIELYGANIPLTEAAEAAGTIPYELLTSLGARYDRRHVTKGR